MDAGEIIMELKHIGLKYNTKGSDIEALSDVNLSIKKGELICALGPSGCGKSTMLNIMAGFLKPTAGLATMLGTPINGVDWHRAIIFQHPVLYPWLNTFDNIAFGLKMRGIPKKKIQQSVERYLNLVELQDFAKSKPYELSGGMRQRAALARELVNEPYMIMMDEPFGALDALTRRKMQQLTYKIWKQTGMTIFLITHDVDEALTLSTRILVMSSRPGTITEEVDTRDIRGHFEITVEDPLSVEKYNRTKAHILSLIT